MKLNNFFGIVVFCVFTLTGCVASYTAPASGGKAYLRVIAKDSAGYFAWSKFTSDICARESPNFPIIGAEDQTDKMLVGFPDKGDPKWDRFERVISADKVFKIRTNTLRRVGFSEGLFVMTPTGAESIRNKEWTCLVEASFSPKQSSYYEMVYDFSPEKCDVTVNEITKQNNNLIRTPVPVNVKQGGCDADKK